MAYLERAAEAIERGDKLQARRLLRGQLLRNPGDEAAWWYLAQVVEQREQVVDCLERVLALNPDNTPARRALSFLNRVRNQESPAADPPGTAADESLTERISDQLDGSLDPGTAGSRLPVHAKRRSPNWPLWIGGLLVAVILLVGVFGPQFAPRDPLEITPLLKVGDKYLRTPYPLFSPGFPLGSDGEGRDLLSRLLWAIRPTMILVVIVASVRLVAGTIIGMIAGWSKRWPGRILDSAIAAAISIPVVIVALAGIAAVGVDMGIWAFIIALSITGWVETARVVREQTQMIREQVYIEAAHALGGSNTWILRRHVLRQVLSLLWMLFAFEISSTLMLVAALGFLGYYIGGDIWVEVSDVTAEAISGIPELGQMLATTETSVIRPWSLIIIGACVFVIVLAFNLLGEGFRRNTGQRSSILTSAIAKVDLWAEQHLWWPLANLSRRQGFRIGLTGAMILVVTMVLILWQTPRVSQENDQHLTSVLPQDELWGSTRRDPYGTRWSEASGPIEAQISWIFKDESGFSGGPAVASDGTLYIASTGGVLYALDPGGSEIWRTTLPAIPVGTPAISTSGMILLTDLGGGVTAFDEKGDLAWDFRPGRVIPASSGPVVSRDGTVYYAQVNQIQAVSGGGDELWLVQPDANVSPTEELKLSPDGDYLFWGEALLRTQDGSSASLGGPRQVDRNLTGADGEVYRVVGHELITWESFPAGNPTSNPISWDFNKYTIARTSKDAGVTPDGTIWLLYSGFARSRGLGEDTRIIWLNSDGSLLGNSFYETRNSQVIAVDQKATVYSCGNLDFGYGAAECQAFSSNSSKPIWGVKLDGSSQVVGGALAPGRMYVASQEGLLYAIGEADQQAERTAEDEGMPTAPAKDDLLKAAGDPVGPRSPSFIVFFSDQSGFSGEPAFGADGKLFIASNTGILYALDPSGEIVWQANLPAAGVGKPLIADQGELYVVDKSGGLSYFSPEGELVWYFAAEPGFQGISGPTIKQDGALFYTVAIPGRGSIQAVSATGDSLWRNEVETDLYYRAPEISASGELLFFRHEIYNARDGSRVEPNLPYEVNRFFRGGDGQDYLLAEGTVAAIEADPSGVVVGEDKVLSPRGAPQSVGVTAEGVVWMFYNYETYWFSRDGEALGVSNVGEGWADYFVGVDRDFTVYVCGRDLARRFEAQLACFALSPDSGEPLWSIELSPDWDKLAGGLLAPGGIYISTEDGSLYLIKDAD